jgi:serine/threonine protein kinase
MYGSPEQIAGASYNASTDMFSLGMMLFEMCHPTFGTRMERATVMHGVRTRRYPNQETWPFQTDHPQVKVFLDRLLDPSPLKRPTADDAVRFFRAVANPSSPQVPSTTRVLQRFVGVPGSPLVSGQASERTFMLSIDCSVTRDGNLGEMTTLIRDVWEGVRVLQCGRRMQEENKCVVEFVLASSPGSSILGTVAVAAVTKALLDVEGVTKVNRV